MPRHRLTDQFVQSLKPCNRATTYWDTEIRAFGVRVSKFTKTFVLVHNGGRRISLGHFPLHKVTQARRSALKAKYDEPASKEPAERRHRASRSLETFLETYKPDSRPKTRKERERALRRHLQPILGAKPLDAISTHDVTAITDKLLHVPSEAIHAHSAIKTFFGWALRRQMISRDPTQGLPLPARPASRTRLITEQEFCAIWQSCTDYPFGPLVKLLFLTGQRKGELSQLKREHMHEMFFTIPDYLAKNHKEHLVPTAPLVCRLLAAIPQSPVYLFSSPGSQRPFNAFSQHKEDLDARSGVTDWVLHDCRRFFSTKMAEWDIAPPDVVEAILNHSTGVRSQLQRVYDRHTRLPQMRRALIAYEHKLSQLLSAKNIPIL